MHSNRSLSTLRLVALVAALTLAWTIEANAQTLDARFGDRGSALTDFAGNQDRAEDVAVDAAGRSIVAGSSRGERSAFAVARHRPDGSLDRSFSGDGRQTARFSTGSAAAQALAIDRSGRYVVAGTIYGPGDADARMALVRINRDGRLDASFGRSGRVTIGSSRALAAHDVAIDGSGRIVLSGAAGAHGEAQDMAIVRLSASGEPDAGFGRRGLREIDFGGDYDYAHSVAVGEDGAVTVAGGADAEESGAAAIARLNADGSADEDFGSDGDGTVTVDFGPANESASALAIQADGRVLVAGGGLGSSAFLARLTEEGVLDPSFSGDGKVERRPGTTTAADYGDIAVAPEDGQIVVLGGATGPRNDGYNLLDRYAPDGTVESQGTDGRGGVALALQADGKAIVAGERDGDFLLSRFR